MVTNEPETQGEMFSTPAKTDTHPLLSHGTQALCFQVFPSVQKSDLDFFMRRLPIFKCSHPSPLFKKKHCAHQNKIKHNMYLGTLSLQPLSVSWLWSWMQCQA